MSEPLRFERPALVVLVGPAGSGKSTWAHSHFPGAVVSSDALRGMVGRGDWDQEASVDAFELLERIVVLRLGRGLTTVVDTTGFDRDARRRWAHLAKEAGLEAVAVVLDTPAEVSRERNRHRRDPVPARVLDAQLRRHREVVGELPDDGFVRIATAPSEVARGPAASAAAAEAAERQTSTPAQLEFGLVVARFDWPDEEIAVCLGEVAGAAEQAGFTTLWVMDHLRQIPQVGRAWDPLLESYTTLAYLAGITTKIKLGVLVTNVGFRNIGHLGKIIATLDVLSGGRARCGLGAGWFEQEAKAFGYEFPPAKVRLDGLEDALQALPLVWGPGGKPFDGATISMLDAMNYPRPLQGKIPLLVGGSGEQRTLLLVARHADAANFMGDPDRVSAKRKVLEKHCAAVGRDPGEIAVTHLGSALAAADRDDLGALLEELRPPNTTAEEFAQEVNGGTVDDLVGHFRRYVEVGVSEAMISPPTLSPAIVDRFAPLITRFATESVS